jgi:hypothetical protein
MIFPEFIKETNIAWRDELLQGPPPYSYCLKLRGEDSLLVAYKSPTSLSTIPEDNLSPLSNLSPTSTIAWDSDFGWGGLLPRL